jgi:cytochrome c peroxidase
MGARRLLRNRRLFPSLIRVKWANLAWKLLWPGSRAVPRYEQAFRRVFGRAPNGTDLVRDIVACERTQFSFDSPFDRFIEGDKNTISESAKPGGNLFNTKARCNKCHALTEQKRNPVFFMDKDFHNIGVGILRHIWSRRHTRRSKRSIRATPSMLIVPRFSQICRCLAGSL